MRARRAFLYVPGDDTRKIAKATTLDVDCVCLDMEDGVALSRKDAARATIPAALRELDFGRSERLARSTRPAPAWKRRTWRPRRRPSRRHRHPQGRRRRHDSLGQPGDRGRGAAQRLAPARFTSSPWSKPRAASSTCGRSRADPRLQVLIFGAEDLAGDMGGAHARRGRCSTRLRGGHARGRARAAGHRHGLHRLRGHRGSGPRVDPGRADGVRGQAGYPSQPDCAGPGRAAPSDAAISHAQRVMQAMADHQAEERAHFALDGKMIDMPLVRAAEHVLARARAAGKVADTITGAL